MSVYVSMSLCMPVCMYVRVCMCVSMNVCMYVYMCMYVCMRLCICLKFFGESQNWPGMKSHFLHIFCAICVHFVSHDIIHVLCITINKIYGVWVFSTTCEVENCKIFGTYNQTISGEAL